mmetsp:Transcript_118568/g.369332  ORF Transcript_118568/g.369332 Transcript_118568/m.369332 type:complete len:487 (-) Transcript_118568:77-1537(-)
MASNAPGSWKDFHSVEEYEDFMKDPSRVLRLEWRKARRQQHKGLTSHSWLEAYLQDGNRLRLEFFADTGLTESIFTAGRGERESVVYENRVAGPHEFSRPLAAHRLRNLAARAAERPYSLADWNCHHFVLAVWNGVVIDLLQRTHYPDRVKTNVLWGASESFGKLVAEGTAWAAQLGLHTPPPSDAGDKRREASGVAPGALSRLFLGSYSTSPMGLESYPSSPVASQELQLQSGASSPSRSSARSSAPPLPRGDAPAGAPEGARARVEARQEEGSRVSGEVTATLSAGDEQQRSAQLARALEEGAVCLLAPGAGLRTADLPLHTSWTCRAWADAWLPGGGDAAERLAGHLGSMDAIDLVMRVLVPGTDGSASRRNTNSRFASLSSESFASGDQGDVSSVCFVVLCGSEVRLAIYAVLGHMRSQDPQRRLRLLSGNLHEGKEQTFSYTLLDVKAQDGPVTAKGCIQEELASLQIALTTGDWGFVTLL